MTTKYSVKKQLQASKSYDAKELIKITKRAVFEYGLNPDELWSCTDEDMCPEYEVWIPIPDSGGRYHVSNLGRVKNHKGIMAPQKGSSDGYVRIRLHKCGNKVRYVHRLVAEAFLNNDDPYEKTQVDHLNGHRSDNTILNLEWVTREENMKRAYEKNVFGHWNRKSVVKIKDDTVVRIYGSVSEAAQDIGVTPAYISTCCKNKKMMNGYRYQYYSA